MKAIIFDFDGVIHDTYELCYGLNLKISGKDLTREQHKDFFNGNLFEKVVVDEEKEKAESEQYYKLQNEAYKYLKIDKNIKTNLEKLSENTHCLLFRLIRKKPWVTISRIINFSMFSRRY